MVWILRYFGDKSEYSELCIRTFWMKIRIFWAWYRKFPATWFNALFSAFSHDLHISWCHDYFHVIRIMWLNQSWLNAEWQKMVLGRRRRRRRLPIWLKPLQLCWSGVMSRQSSSVSLYSKVQHRGQETTITISRLSWVPGVFGYSATTFSYGGWAIRSWQLAPDHRVKVHLVNIQWKWQGSFCSSAT